MVRSERFAVVAVTTGWGRDRLAVLAQAVDVQDDRLADEAFHLVDRAGRNADTRQFGRVGSVTGHAPLDDHRVTGHVIIPSDPPANGVGEREDGHDTPVDSMPVLAGTAEGIVDDRRPLAGITVLVPRAREQAGAFSLLLRQRGAEPLEVPTIAIRPLRSTSELDLAVGRLVGGAYDWLVLTSVNGVAALREWGVPPNLVPPVATTVALGEAFPAGSGEVLLARADIASPELGSILRGKGYRAHAVAAYRTVPLDRLEEGARRRLDGGEVDWLAFTASSTVQGFARAYGGPPPGGVRVAVIGPVTAAAAKAAGMRVDATASEHTIPGLVAAIERATG